MIHSIWCYKPALAHNLTVNGLICEMTLQHYSISINLTNCADNLLSPDNWYFLDFENKTTNSESQILIFSNEKKVAELISSCTFFICRRSSKNSKWKKLLLCPFEKTFSERGVSEILHRKNVFGKKKNVFFFSWHRLDYMLLTVSPTRLALFKC